MRWREGTKRSTALLCRLREGKHEGYPTTQPTQRKSVRTSLLKKANG